MNDLADDYPDFSQANEPAKTNQGVTRLRIVLSRWWLMVIFGILGYVVALYTLSISEPSSEARATLEVVTKKKQLVGRGLENDRQAMGQMMATLANKLVGPTQLTKVVNSSKIQAIENAVPPEFSFKPKYWRSEDELRYRSAAEASTPEVVKMITQNLQVAPRQGTSFIDITVTHKDATTAVTIADAIMEEYLATEEKRKTGGTTEAFKILRKEATEAQADLEMAQRALESYKSVIETDGLLKAHQRAIVLLKQRYKKAHPKMALAYATSENLNERFRSGLNGVIQNNSEMEYWAQYIDQIKEHADSIKTAEEAGDEKAKNDAELKWLALVRSALSARLGALQARILSKRSLYDTITSRITEIGVEEESNEGEIRIAEAAYPSGDIVIDKYKRLAQGTVGGILLGLGIAYLLSLLDYKVYDVKSTEEAIGLDCLAAIPEGDAFEIEEEWDNILESAPNSTNAEAIRNLRASVMLLGKPERHKRILVTSAVPGEGKTTIASELAAAFALSEQKTLLIDLDLRKPRVHTLFPKLNKNKGIADVLVGNASLSDVIQQTHVEGLHLISAGSRVPNPAEILQDVELEATFQQLSEHYDRVIIDTPPVLPVSDTRLLVGHTQSVILVVRALKAPVGAIMRAKDLLIQANAPIAGVVVNGMKAKHMGSAYYGYRGYGEYGEYGEYGVYGGDYSESDRK